MPKVKVSITINQEILNLIKECNPENYSDFINDILSQKMKEEGDISDEFKKIELERRELEKKERILVLELHKKIEEGNRKEREEAENILLEEQKKQLELELKRKNFMNKFLISIERYKLQEDLEKLQTYSDVIKLLGKISACELEVDRCSTFTGCFSYASYIYDKYVKKIEVKNAV